MTTYEEKITKICGKGVSNYVVDLSVVVVFKAFYIEWVLLLHLQRRRSAILKLQDS